MSSRANLNAKRQILANLLEGKTDSIQAYRANQQRLSSPYRWIVTDEIARTTYGIGQDGTQYLLTVDNLTKVPLNIIWRVMDHSGGISIPAPDEEY